MSTYISQPKSQRGSGHISVPVRIMKVIPADARFEAELTDDGILFRFMGIVPRSEPVELPTIAAPSWARNGADS